MVYYYYCHSNICKNNRCYLLNSRVINIHEFVLIIANNIRCTPQIFEIQHIYMINMGFICLKYMYIVLFLLPFFIMACSLHTSHYRSRSKRNKLQPVKQNKKSTLIYTVSGGIETHATNQMGVKIAH